MCSDSCEDLLLNWTLANCRSRKWDILDNWCNIVIWLLTIVHWWVLTSVDWWVLTSVLWWLLTSVHWCLVMTVCVIRCRLFAVSSEMWSSCSCDEWPAHGTSTSVSFTFLSYFDMCCHICTVLSFSALPAVRSPAVHTTVAVLLLLHEILLHWLHLNVGLTGIVLEWIHSFLTDRTQQVLHVTVTAKYVVCASVSDVRQWQSVTLYFVRQWQTVTLYRVRQWQTVTLYCVRQWLTVPVTECDSVLCAPVIDCDSVRQW